MAKNNENTTNNTLEKVLNVIQKNRKVLLIGLSCIVLGIVVLTAVYAINESTAKKAIAELDVFSDTLFEADKESPETAQLVAEIEQFAENNTGFAGAEAYNLVAGFHADKKAWDLAEAAWLNAAAKAPNDFLAPTSLFNAAVAAEEQGNTSNAIDYYTQAAEFPGVFAGVVRAYLSIGRIYEAENNTAAALEIYEKIVSEYSGNENGQFRDELTDLAQSRIILLSN